MEPSKIPIPIFEKCWVREKQMSLVKHKEETTQGALKCFPSDFISPKAFRIELPLHLQE